MVRKSALAVWAALALAGCSTLENWSPGKAERREFRVRNAWVHSAPETRNEGYRKINRMTPLIAGNLIISGNSIDGLVAHSRDDGHEVWRLRNVNGVEGGAALIRDRIFFGASDGMFTSVNVRNGQILWSVPTKAETLSEPLLDGETGRVYILTSTNTVFAFEADSGKTAWVYTRPDANNFSIRGGTKPALHNGTLYVGFSDGYLAALNSKNGQILWDVQLNRNKKFRDVDTSPVINGDRLYVAGYDDRLYCLNAGSGEVVWRQDGGGYAGLTIVGNRLYYPTSDGDLRALDKETGKVLWTVSVKDGIATAVVPYKGLLTFGESRGRLRFIETTTGKDVGSFEPGRGVFSAPSVDEKAGRVYFISNEANVYAIDAAWTFKPAFRWLQPQGAAQ